jgi:hypothetical protein
MVAAMNDHLSPRGRVIVSCIGIRQRAKGVRYFVGEYRHSRDRHDLSAACLHATNLRERAELAHRDAALDVAGVPIPDRRHDARRMG